MCGDGIGLPSPRDVLQLGKSAGKFASERLGRFPVCGHIDAARLHDHRVDETVDALEMDCAAHGAVESSMVTAGNVYGEQGQSHTNDGKQPKKGDDAIQARFQAVTGQPGCRQSQAHVETFR